MVDNTMHKVDYAMDTPNRYLRNVEHAANAPQRAVDNTMNSINHAIDAPNRVANEVKGFFSKFGLNF